MDEENLVADLPEVARRIRNNFYDLKRQQTGRSYNPHPRHRVQAYWDKAAELCVDVGADSYSYVRAAFLYCSVPGGPFPNNMCSQAAVRWYREYRQVYGTDQDTKQDVFMMEVKGLLADAAQKMFAALVHKEFKTPSEFLLDEYYSSLDTIPAYIRVILLPKDVAVLDKFGKLAFMELRGCQRLLNILKALGCDLRFLDRIKP